MKLRTSFAQFLKRDTPPDEEGGRSSQESRNVGDSEKGPDETHAPDADGTVEDEEEEEDLDLEREEEAEGEVEPEKRRLLSRIFSFVFPSPSTEEEIRLYTPHYRHIPIVSGVIIPFSILLEIPGLTERWYIVMEGTTVVASKPNPMLLVVGISLSMVCAVLANICLIVRFLEKRIVAMTILCIVFLSIHDMINVVALATFGISKDGYTYGQAFWMTLCSTVASSLTNLTLIVDIVRTPDFSRSGSGLTRKQRSLAIIIIGLFCYIGLGALINTLLLGLSFINGLYFTVVTIETIGFGDIVPDSPGSRVFICFYATLGIINLAFVVGYFRETVLEGIDFGYRKRILAIQERRRAARRRRRAENRWRHAIVWRLRARHARVWIPEKDTTNHQSLWSKLKFHFWCWVWRLRSGAWRRRHMTRPWHGMVLNLWALSRSDLEGAALEAGVPLDTLLPPDFYESYDQDSCLQQSDVDYSSSPWWFVLHPVYHHDEPFRAPLTHHRLGAMAALLTKFALAISQSGAETDLPGRSSSVEESSAMTRPDMPTLSSSGSLSSATDDTDGDYRTIVSETETHAYHIRAIFSWVWFLTFWMGGAAIFMATENWTYASAVYFCFISFTTIGYGDLSPKTPAGRSIFVVWALVGVATMTIFISIIAEAYTSRYKGIMGRNRFKKAVQKYRERIEVEAVEKAQEIGAAVRFHPQETVLPGVEGTKEELPSITTTATDTVEFQQAHSRAQSSLEQLPEHILTEARSIQQYMQLIGDHGGRLVDVERYVDERIWNLMDDIVDSKKLTECTKVDILKDDETRQTLMLLGMERSIRELVNIAEQAIAAIQERDRIIASLRQEREEGAGDEAGGSADETGGSADEGGGSAD